MLDHRVQCLANIETEQDQRHGGQPCEITEKMRR